MRSDWSREINVDYFLHVSEKPDTKDTLQEHTILVVNRPSRYAKRNVSVVTNIDKNVSKIDLKSSWLTWDSGDLEKKNWGP